MKQRFDLSELEWQVAGYDPCEWQRDKSMEIGAKSKAAIPHVPATVPGSVQKALLDACLLPDWNIGLNSWLCEWVENRHWIYETVLPDEWLAQGKTFRLRCLGLDYCGCIVFGCIVSIHAARSAVGNYYVALPGWVWGRRRLI